MIIDLLLDIIYPLRCSFCKEIISRGSKFFLCNMCQEKVKFIKNGCEICGKSLITGYEHICTDCRINKHEFERCISAVEYRDEVKYALIKYKFFGKKPLVNTFTELIIDKVKEFSDIDMIVGVPMYILKYKQRGFNQTEILAKAISKKMRIPYFNGILTKVKNTKSQSVLSRKKRLMNLKDAFKVMDNTKITNKNILIVDDIYTTGATASECATCLKKAGASNVYVLTIASGKGY